MDESRLESEIEMSGNTQRDGGQGRKTQRGKLR